MRRPVIAANWKMYKTVREAEAFVDAFLPRVADARDVEIVIAPPFPALAAVGRRLAGSRVSLAAQNVNPEKQGAFTGEVSPPMLAELGCAFCMAGYQLLTRKLAGHDDRITTLFYPGLVACLAVPAVFPESAFDVPRQPRVDRQRHLLQRDAGGGVEVRDLAARVHARVGSARAHQRDRLLHHQPQRRFDDARDGAERFSALGFLFLPAVEERAVVGERKLQRSTGWQRNR